MIHAYRSDLNRRSARTERYQKVFANRPLCLLAQPGHRARQTDAWHFQLAATARDFSDALAHKRGLVNGAFARDDQVRGAQAALQLRVAGKQVKAGFKSRAKKRAQAKAQSARGACARRPRYVAMQVPLHNARQLAQTAFGHGKVFRSQSFLRPVNSRTTTGTEQKILHVHGHD